MNTNKFLLSTYYTTLLYLLLTPIASLADNPPPVTYSGFNMDLLIAAPVVTPFRETTQDLDAILLGNGLSPSTLAANQTLLKDSLIPYSPDLTTHTVIADNVNLQALATTIGLSNYDNVATQTAKDYAVNNLMPTTIADTLNLAIGSAGAAQAAAANETTGITTQANSNVIAVHTGALASFNVRSISDPTTYSISNSQRYLGLVSGSAVPVTSMQSLSTLKDKYPAYQLAVAREAAVQSAAVTALQEFAEGNVPLAATAASALGGNFVKSNLIPTQNNITSFMATRRLNPTNNWYYRIQQASPIELQRESLYLQAESLYELDKIRQQNQQNKLLLSLLLIEQSRAAIAGLNMQVTMSPPQASSAPPPATAAGTLPVA